MLLLLFISQHFKYNTSEKKQTLFISRHMKQKVNCRHDLSFYCFFILLLLLDCHFIIQISRVLPVSVSRPSFILYKNWRTMILCVVHYVAEILHVSFQVPTQSTRNEDQERYTFNKIVKFGKQRDLCLFKISLSNYCQFCLFKS